MSEENKKHKSGFKKFISGDILLNDYVTSHIPFILVITVLLVFYIASRYNIEKTVRDIDKLSKDISELQKHALNVKTTYQTTTRMLYINDKLAPSGVEVSKEPIKDIIIYNDSVN
jgi:hypothetical protein